MYGILLMSIGALFGELSMSANKISVKNHALSFIDNAIMVATAGLVPLMVTAIAFPETFAFSRDSLPTFTARMILEVPLGMLSAYALMKADRSTFAFFRSLTIPLLVIVDLFLAYPTTVLQIAGALIITAALAFSARGNISRVGMGWCLLTATMAVATISLYKIDITRGHNSVIGEQIVAGVISFFFLALAKLYLHEPYPMETLKRDHRTHLSILATAVSQILESYSYKFIAGTALVTATKRGVGIVLAIISGKMIFHEDKTLERVLIGGAIVAGLVLMATPPHVIDAAKQVATVLLANN